MPRNLGVLLSIDDLGWMLYLSPSLARAWFPFVATASAAAEVPLMFWLLVVGVNARRWQEQASAGTAPMRG